jgi:transcriptional regulator with XRE-family HTH domain
MEVPVQGIGTRIRDRRKKVGLTQRQLSDLIGVGSDTVSKHERGDMGVSAETLFAYAKALETTAQYLAGDAPDGAGGATRPGPKATALRAVPTAGRAVPMALARLLNDGRCNPISDEEMAHLTRHLDEGNSAELVDLEIHLLAHRAERDRTEDALAKFRAAISRARKERGQRLIEQAPAPPTLAKAKAKKPELTR